MPTPEMLIIPVICACQVRAMCSGLLRTLSRQTFDDKLQHPFTAHPKVDPVTGDLLVGPLLPVLDSGPFC